MPDARLRAKRATEREAREYVSTLSLKGIAGKITCPLFIVAGELDRRHQRRKQCFERAI